MFFWKFQKHLCFENKAVVKCSFEIVYNLGLSLFHNSLGNFFYVRQTIIEIVKVLLSLLFAYCLLPIDPMILRTSEFSTFILDIGFTQS